MIKTESFFVFNKTLCFPNKNCWIKNKKKKMTKFRSIHCKSHFGCNKSRKNTIFIPISMDNVMFFFGFLFARYCVIDCPPTIQPPTLVGNSDLRNGKEKCGLIFFFIPFLCYFFFFFFIRFKLFVVSGACCMTSKDIMFGSWLDV